MFPSGNLRSSTIIKMHTDREKKGLASTVQGRDSAQVTEASPPKLEAFGLHYDPAPPMYPTPQWNPPGLAQECRKAPALSPWSLFNEDSEAHTQTLADD